MTACALVPIKTFATAKTRLRSVLSNDEASFLAQQMAVQTVEVLRNSASIDRIVLLGEAQTVAKLADDFGCETAIEDPAGSLSTNLFSAAQALGLTPADTLAIFPADTPLVTPADVESLLDHHETGLTLCPAALDGGTNALLLTPPDAIEFSYGHDSARLHAQAGRAAGLPVQIISSPTFSRDIDTPADLEWLCRQPGVGRFHEALHRSGITAKALNCDAALSA